MDRVDPSKVLNVFTVFSMSADTLDAGQAGLSWCAGWPVQPMGPKEVQHDPWMEQSAISSMAYPWTGQLLTF